MNKEKLRKQMIAQLKQLPPQEKRQIDLKLSKQLFQSDIWKNSQVIGTTYAQPFEWDTKLIMEKGWEENKTIAIPKSHMKEKILSFYKIEKNSRLINGFAGIMEPIEDEMNYIQKENIDLLIVPGLLFDSSGYRLGFGGGFYDRFLQQFPNVTLSLVSEIQYVNKLKAEIHDIPVKVLVLENEIKYIGKN